MNIWVVTCWNEGGEYMNEVMSILFDPDLIAPKVAELFAECPNYDEIHVECWHRDDVDGWDASYYETECFYREEDE